MKYSLDSLIEELPYFDNPRGFMRYGNIPYKVYRNLKQPASNLINEDAPAKFKLTSDTGGGVSLSVWVWEGVPADFCNVLFYHELKEAEFIFADRLSKEEAHKKAVPLHMAYAKKFLSKSTYQNFLKWQANYE